jgi:hypothetical protein
MLPFGMLLASGAVGLRTGFAVPVLGEAAAIGLVLYRRGGGMTMEEREWLTDRFQQHQSHLRVALLSAIVRR